MDEFKQRVDELAALMEEFQLAEAKLEGDDWKVAFRARRASIDLAIQEANAASLEVPTEAVHVAESFSVIQRQEESSGEPVSSPMNGIYYGRPSPNGPPFVREGEEVQEGQVLALIEAMKVFNEIVAPFDGTITRILAKNSDLVQADEPLMYIEKAQG